MGELRMLAKDGDSGEQGCPSVWVEDRPASAASLTADREFVVQGDEVDGATLSGLPNVLPGETAVRIRMSVLRAALDQYDQGAS